MLKAVDLHRQGHTTKAAEIYEHILSKNSKDPDARHLLGLIAHATGDEPRAENLIREALVYGPKMPHLHNNLGEVLRASGPHRTDEALASFKACLLLEPSDSSAHLNSGLVYMQTKEWSLAVKEFEEAHRLAPEREIVLENLATSLSESKRLDEAVALYKRLLMRR